MAYSSRWLHLRTFLQLVVIPLLVTRLQKHIKLVSEHGAAEVPGAHNRSVVVQVFDQSAIHSAVLRDKRSSGSLLLGVEELDCGTEVGDIDIKIPSSGSVDSNIDSLGSVPQALVCSNSGSYDDVRIVTLNACCGHQVAEVFGINTRSRIFSKTV